MNYFKTFVNWIGNLVNLAKMRIKPTNQNLDLDSDLYAEMQGLREEAVKNQKKEMSSKEYLAAVKNLENITVDFILALRMAFLMSSRFEGHANFLVFRYFDLLIEAVASVHFLIKEGMLNSAKRELRYILETSIKLSFIDVVYTDKSLKWKKDELKKRTPFSKWLEVWKSEFIFFEDFKEAVEFKNAIKSAYGDLSQEIHISIQQLENYESRSKKGEPIGLEKSKTFAKITKQTFQVYDLCLPLIYHCLGLSLAGDIFTLNFDDNRNWKFHKGKYTRRLSTCFDYKHERQNRKT